MSGASRRSVTCLAAGFDRMPTCEAVSPALSLSTGIQIFAHKDIGVASSTALAASSHDMPAIGSYSSGAVIADCLGTATTSISSVLTTDSSFFDVFFLKNPLTFPSL